MILADKIIELRKKNGWSQEDLAEKMDVSRQSISKWESAQSVPDMNRILKLSQVFSVSTDFLLKDDLDVDPVSENAPLPVDSDIAARPVSMEEATSFLKDKDLSSRKIALGVMLCILSPIAIVLLSSAQEAGLIGLTEFQATGFGLLAIFLLVGPAVALFVTTGLRMSKYEYMEKENIETSYGVDGMVRERREQYRRTFNTQLVTGIVLCVVSVLPIFVTMILAGEEGSKNSFTFAIPVAVLLALVAIGVLLIVRSSIVWGSFQQLLEEGDYSRANKEESKRYELLTTIYWCAVTAGFLAFSFITQRWDRSWIVWPVAGVTYGLVIAIAKSLRKKD